MKPQNILIVRSATPSTYEPRTTEKRASERFVAKLCDFGLSININRGKPEELPKYLGTPLWRAPEVLRQGDVGIQRTKYVLCDLYSLGLVIWSTFTNAGRPVLTEDTERSGIEIEDLQHSLRWYVRSDGRQRLDKSLFERVF